MEEKKERLEETEYGKSGRLSSNLPYIGIAAAAVILTLGAGLGFYFAKSGAYQETFMPNTTINGRAVAGMDVEEVKSLIESELQGYELKIFERTGSEEVITKEDVGLRTEFEGGLEQILELQEPMMWVKSLWTEVDYQIGTMLVYNEEMLAEKIRGLSFMDKETMTEPENAYLSDYQFDTNSYEIIAPMEGTELVEDAVIQAISEALMNLDTEVDLDAAGCYTRAAVLSDDPELTALAEELNHYVGAVVTHRFGDMEEVLDGDVIHQWLAIDGMAVTLDENGAAEYIKSLAKKYNTAYEKRPFLTTYGDVVTIPGGSYGWRMNQTKEVEAVLEAVKEGVIRTREAEWLQEGASHGEYDYGDTYVEVNLTGQHLFFYKDGELLVECDFVSGNAARGWSTPAGIYPLTYKERNATLRGEGYATPVSYWMPFNGGIGLHDADWRASFGGAIYKTNGSHGCVNLPPKAAKIIYENIAKGDPVICYHLDGTETKTTSKASAINTTGVASVLKGEDAGGNAAETKPAAGTGNSSGSKPSGNSGGSASAKPAVPETKPVETKPAVPETQAPTAAPETAPAVPQSPETTPETSAPAGPGAESTPAPTLTPETGGALTEIVPAGPNTEPETSAPAVTPPNETMTPETGAQGPAATVPAITETRPAGVGPGSGPVSTKPSGPASDPSTGPMGGLPTGPAANGPGGYGPGYSSPAGNGPGGITTVIDPSNSGPGA